MTALIKILQTVLAVLLSVVIVCCFGIIGASLSYVIPNLVLILKTVALYCGGLFWIIVILAFLSFLLYTVVDFIVAVWSKETRTCKILKP